MIFFVFGFKKFKQDFVFQKSIVLLTDEAEGSPSFNRDPYQGV